MWRGSAERGDELRQLDLAVTAANGGRAEFAASISLLDKRPLIGIISDQVFQKV